MKPARQESGTPSHPIDKRSGRSPRSHHRLFRGSSHEAPVVKSEIFGRLGIKLPLTAPSPVGFKESKFSKDSNGHEGQPIDLKAFAPVINQPLTPVFTYHEGRAVGGGGTSREALRRARRNLRKLRK